MFHYQLNDKGQIVGVVEQDSIPLITPQVSLNQRLPENAAYILNGVVYPEKKILDGEKYIYVCDEQNPITYL